MHSATTRAVLARLRALGVVIPGPDENWCIRRTYAGHKQRCGESGALSWTLAMVDCNAFPEQSSFNNKYGGYHAATLCAKPGATLTEHGNGMTTTLDPAAIRNWRGG